MVVLWVSRPHLSMDNSLRCPWGLHLAPRRRRRVTATAAVLERPLVTVLGLPRPIPTRTVAKPEPKPALLGQDGGQKTPY